MSAMTEKLSSLGVTPQQALEFIMANVSNPKAIYDVCLKYGVSSEILAEIIQPNFPGVTASVVEQFFTSNGLNGSILGSSIVNITNLQSLDTPLDQTQFWTADGQDIQFTLVFDLKEVHPTQYQSVNAGRTEMEIYNWGSDDSIVLLNAPVSATTTPNGLYQAGEPIDAISILSRDWLDPNGIRVYGAWITFAGSFYASQDIVGDTNDAVTLSLFIAVDTQPIGNFGVNSRVDGEDSLYEVWTALGLGTLVIETIGFNLPDYGIG